MKRTYILSTSKPNRFWTIRTDGSLLFTTSGNVSENGQENLEKFADAAACLEEVKKRTAQKTTDGYQRVMHHPDPSEKERNDFSNFRSDIHWDGTQRAIDYIKNLDNKQLLPHNLDYALAMGMKLSGKEKDTELMDFCLARIPNETDVVELAFGLAGKAAVDNNKEAMLKYAHRAIELGKTTADFFDDRSFAPFVLDDDFRAAIRVEDIGNETYHRLTAGNKIKVIIPAPKGREPNQYMDISFCKGEKIEPEKFEELPDPLCFEIRTNHDEPLHFLEGKEALVVSEAFLQALKKIGIENFEAFPVILKEESREWNGFYALNILGRYHVIDKEASKCKEEFMGNPSFSRVVFHDLKYKKSYKLFRPLYLEFALYMANSLMEQLTAIAPAEGWGLKLEEVTISRHQKLPAGEDLSNEEWLEKGRDYFRNEQLDMAKTCAEQLIGKSPDFAPAYNLAGVVYESFGEKIIYDDAAKGWVFYNQAVEYLTKAVTLDHTMLCAWRNLARIYEAWLPQGNGTYDGNKQMDVEQSKKCYQKMLELEKSEENYSNVLKFLYREEKEKFLLDWTSHDPSNANAWGALGDYYYDIDDIENAIKYLEKSLSIKSTGMSCYHLFYIFLNSGQWDKAEACIEKVDANDFGYGFRQITRSYYDDLKKRLRAERKKTEKETKPRPKAKKAPKTTKLQLALEARYAGLWDSLEDIPAGLLPLLKVTPADIRQAIEKLDEKKIIAQYKVDLESALNPLENPAQYKALVFEWYYAGADSYDSFTMGYVSENCEISDPDNPDQDPDLSADEDEIYAFDVCKVMGDWYDTLCPLYEENEAEIPKEYQARYSKINDTYNNIFKYKLFIIASRAYALITDEKPTYLFLETHEHSPGVMLASDGK